MNNSINCGRDRLSPSEWFDIMRYVVEEATNPRNINEDPEKIAKRIILDVHFSKGISPKGIPPIKVNEQSSHYMRDFEERTGQYD
jgi:hypothetical protein